MANTLLAEPPVNFDEVATITDDAMYEVVDGQLVEMPPMSAYAMLVSSRVHGHLFIHAERSQAGQPVMETLFRLPIRVPRNRRPDVAFVSAERWPLDRPIPAIGVAWDVIPDLVIEVVSPTDRFEEIVEKLDEYFQVGVRLVWVIAPQRRLVYVFTTTTDVRIIRAHEALTGDGVLSGFSVPVAALFPPMIPGPGLADDE